MVGLNGIVIKSHGGTDVFGFQSAIEVAVLEARDGVPARIAERLGRPRRLEGSTMYARIAGTGSYLPEKILTNADLEKIVDTSDEWIRTRTGIEQPPRGRRGRDHDRSRRTGRAQRDGGRRASGPATST